MRCEHCHGLDGVSGDHGDISTVLLFAQVRQGQSRNGHHVFWGFCRKSPARRSDGERRSDRRIDRPVRSGHEYGNIQGFCHDDAWNVPVLLRRARFARHERRRVRRTVIP